MCHCWIVDPPLGTSLMTAKPGHSVSVTQILRMAFQMLELSNPVPASLGRIKILEFVVVECMGMNILVKKPTDGITTICRFIQQNDN